MREVKLNVFRVLRGLGDWYNCAPRLRAAVRCGLSRFNRNSSLGVRLVRGKR